MFSVSVLRDDDGFGHDLRNVFETMFCFLRDGLGNGFVELFWRVAFWYFVFGIGFGGCGWVWKVLWNYVFWDEIAISTFGIH
jgi:hypothetical protein